MADARGDLEDLVDSIFGVGPLVELVPASRLALRELAAARAALDALEAELVRRGRLDGATWHELAADLGLARSTLSARHGRRTRRLADAPAGQ